MPQQLQEIGLTKTIELRILNNLNSLVKFEVNDSSLDNVLINGISIAYYDTSLSPSRKPILAIIDQYASFITLADPKNNVYNRSLPWSVLTGDLSGITYIHPKLVSLRNSFVEFPRIGTATIPAGGASMVFTFYYKKYDPAIHKLTEEGEQI